MIVAALSVAAILVVYVARTLQVLRARNLFAGYLTAPATPLAAAPVPLDEFRVRLPVHIFELPSTTYGSQAATVIVDVGGCSESTIDVTFHYEDTAPAMGLGFSRTLTVPMGSASVPTHVIFPVYALHRSGTLISWFAGVDMPSTAVRCVQLRSMQNAGMAAPHPFLARHNRAGMIANGV